MHVKLQTWACWWICSSPIPRLLFDEARSVLTSFPGSSLGVGMRLDLF